MNKTIKKKKDTQKTFRLLNPKTWAMSGNLICEEFCYNSGLKPIQVQIFPSKGFESQNIDYILSGIKNAERFTDK